MLENMGKGSFSHLYVCSRCAPWCSGPTSAHIDLAIRNLEKRKKKRSQGEDEETEEGVKSATCRQVVGVAVTQVPLADLKKTF